MPIRPFLASQAFEPELIQQMSLALESVCETLELSFTDDPATRLVASKIIGTGAARCAGRADPKRNDTERVQGLLISIQQKVSVRQAVRLHAAGDVHRKVPNDGVYA